MSNEDFDSIVVEEYDRQTKYYNDLQRLNFFENNELVCDISPEQKKKLKKEKTIAEESYTTDEEDGYDKEAQNDQSKYYYDYYRIINELTMWKKIET